MGITHLVFVPIHPGQSADMSEDVLDSIGKLEGIDISEAVLNVGVDNELCQTKDFSTQVEGVSETRLLPFLRRQGPRWSKLAGRSWCSMTQCDVLDWLQVHVVVEVKVIQILQIPSAQPPKRLDRNRTFLWMSRLSIL